MRIAITGTPCTGKTAVARALARKLGWKLVELNSLAEEKGLYCGYDRARKTKIVDIGKIKKDIQKFSKGDMIIESHYAHEIPNDLTIVLRCGLKELKKRMQKKKWPEKKIQENLQAEIFEVCKQEALELGKIMEIETTGKRLGQVAGEILGKMKRQMGAKL